MAAPAAAFAGAWTLPEGTGQWLATLAAATSTGYFASGGLASTPRYDKVEAQLLVEYGLTDRLTAIMQSGIAAYRHRRADRCRSAPVLATPNSARATASGKVKTGCCPARRHCGFRVPPTPSNPAAIGYTDVEADFRALVGHNFMLGDMPAFFDFEAAQRQRAGRAERIPRRRNVRRESAAAMAAAGAEFQCHFRRRGQYRSTGGSYEY